MNPVDEAIESIYDAALEPDQWRVALDRIIELTGSKSGNLISSDRDHQRCDVAVFSGIDPDWIRRYNEHYHRFDPSMPVFSRHGGRAIADQVTRNGFRDEFRQARRFYHELMLPQEFHHTAGAGLFFTKTHNAGIILQRSRSQGEYDSAALEILDRLAPHIRRSLKLAGHHSRLGFQRGLEAAYERGETGVLLLDETGRVRFANAKAERFARACPAIDLRHDRLVLADPAMDGRLQAMIAAATATDEGPTRRSGSSLAFEVPEAGAVLGIRVIPVGPRLGTSVPAPVAGRVLVELTESSGRILASIERLAEHFGLTQAEVEVLSGIGRGESLEAIAASRVRSIHTVRSQTKAVMRKLGASRRSDLVRMVLTDPVTGAGTGPG